jgi:hypothetical protein
MRLHSFYSSLMKILLHVIVRFPWRRDVGALSRNNAILQHCYVFLVTQQCKWTAYPQRHTTMQYIITYATMDTERDDFYGYEIAVYGLGLICGVRC